MTIKLGDRVKILSRHSTGCNYLVRPVVAVTGTAFCINAIPAIHGDNCVFAWYYENDLIRAALQFRYEGGLKRDIEKEAIQTGAMAIRFLLNR